MKLMSWIRPFRLQQAKSVGRIHADLPRLPLHRKWGHNALPGQPHQLRFLDGINANLSGKFKNFCKDRQEGGEVREVGWVRGAVDGKKKKNHNQPCEIIR